MTTVKENRTINIRKLIKQYFGVVKFSQLIDYPQSQVSQWKSDKNPKGIGEIIARDIENKLSLPHGYLDKDNSLQEVKHKMLPVPLMEFKVCANDGIEAWGEKIIDDMLIPERIVHKKQLNLNNIICIEVTGDCMHPTYNDGDYVFIDRSHCDAKYVINNSVYVVKYNYELSLKRLEKFPNYMLMKSDNPNKILFRDREVLFSDVDEGKVNFEIVGLVVYSMGD